MQHFSTYPGSTFVCGADAYGQRNSLRDADPDLTTCPRCKASEAWKAASEESAHVPVESPARRPAGISTVTDIQAGIESVFSAMIPATDTVSARFTARGYWKVEITTAEGITTEAHDVRTEIIGKKTLVITTHPYGSPVGTVELEG
jgi:hypothetical protein